MLPPPANWEVVKGTEDPHAQALSPSDGGVLVRSPSFEIEADRHYVFVMHLDVLKAGRVAFRLTGRVQSKPIASRHLDGHGETAIHIQHNSNQRQTVWLEVSSPQNPKEEYVAPDIARASFRLLKLEVDEYAAPSAETFEPVEDTNLPHWGPFRRRLHAACKSSKRLNTAVAAIEMQFGCEELVSVPQYVALCPTGQCNALCEFCSVTINRTGIVKRQLSSGNLDKILAPVSKTVHLYGLEGNGEPTLYRDFEGLLQRLLSNGSKAYLITNGSRLNRKLISLLSNENVDSVNFSLNAATAETHRRVMKLKAFPPSSTP